MANTYLYRRKGEQFTANDGTILAGGFVYFYQAGTAVLQATYSDAAGTVPNTNPLALNSDGRLTQPVYLGTAGDYKELVTTSGGATVDPWPFDNIPAAVPSANTTVFSPLLITWVNVSPGTTSPAASDAGSGYLCNTSSGSITINLPSAASVGSGKGFAFKKTNAANTVTIDPSGAQTIDGVSVFVLSAQYEMVYLVSDGANWDLVSNILPQSGKAQSVTASSATLNIDMSLAWNVALTLSANVTAFTIANWPAGAFARLVLDIASTGAFNVTGWPGTTIWPGGGAPTITSGSGKKDTIVLTSADGANFRGFVVAQNMS
jgi:hypothetical protein